MVCVGNYFLGRHIAKGKTMMECMTSDTQIFWKRKKNNSWRNCCTFVRIVVIVFPWVRWQWKRAHRVRDWNRVNQNFSGSTSRNILLLHALRQSIKFGVFQRLSTKKKKRLINQLLLLASSTLLFARLTRIRGHYNWRNGHGGRLHYNALPLFSRTFSHNYLWLLYGFKIWYNCLRKVGIKWKLK